MTDATDAARRILDRVNAIRKRPTIAELEAILQAPDPPPVTIKPDGSIGVGETDEVIVARALLASDAATVDRCAQIVQGTPHKGIYRQWSFWPGGNRAQNDPIVTFADDAATAIRALAKEGT